MTSQDTLSELAQVAWRIRRFALRMGEVQGQGYVGQAQRASSDSVSCDVIVLSGNVGGYLKITPGT